MMSDISATFRAKIPIHTFDFAILICPYHWTWKIPQNVFVIFREFLTLSYANWSNLVSILLSASQYFLIFYNSKGFKYI